MHDTFQLDTFFSSLNKVLDRTLIKIGKILIHLRNSLLFTNYSRIAKSKEEASSNFVRREGEVLTTIFRKYSSRENCEFYKICTKSRSKEKKEERGGRKMTETKMERSCYRISFPISPRKEDRKIAKRAPRYESMGERNF